MLRKLRLKFIALTMSIIALVLAVVFTVICVINYQQSLGRVQEALEGSLASVEHGLNAGLAGQGQPDLTDVPAGVGMTEGAPNQVRPPESSNFTSTPPEIGGKRAGSEAFIPVALYYLNSDNTLGALPSRTTASLSEEVLSQAAQQLSDAPDGTGSLDNLGLFYAKRHLDGTVYLAFADISAASEWQTLALTLAGVGAVALVVFFIINVFFARWALRPVEQAWMQQRRFVADASHELKTPLTVILANTSILLEHPERSITSQSQWVESTQTEAGNMQQLVGDLLLLAKLDEDEAAGATSSNDATQEPALINLTDLVEGELLQFESIAFERNVALTSQLEPNVPIHGDIARLRRLASTLIDNACKYTNEGGEVHVTLQQVPHHLELVVRNTGLAITEDDLPHIFDRFYRADKARTRDAGGFGLGLAIGRAVAEEHGGTLTATSTEEATTFTAKFSL